MAGFAYAPHWTSRMRVSYFAAQAVHSQMWRFPGPASGSGVTDLVAVLIDYYTALAPILYQDFIVNAVTVADIDSTFFLPISNPFVGLGGDLTMADFEPQEKAFQGTWVGRTTGGNPWHVSQFGISAIGLEGVASHNFRVLRIENATVAAALDVLQAAGGTIIGNDAQPVAFYDYLNVKDNDRYVKKVRRGA